MKTIFRKIERSIIIFTLGCISGSFLQIFLYFRKNPFGVEYVLDIKHYLYTAMYWEWYGMALISLPFFIISCLYYEKIKQSKNKLRLFYGLHITITFLSLLVGQLDHELQRFMGMHISFNYIATYSSLKGIPDAIWNTFAEDCGGSYSSIILLFIPVIFLFLSVFIKKFHFEIKASDRKIGIIFAIFTIYIYITGFLCWNIIPGSGNRRVKVCPPIILTYKEIKKQFIPVNDYSTIKDSITCTRSLWKEEDTLNEWNFTSNRYPMRKSYNGKTKSKSQKKYNIILLVLETFRAKNMKSFNPTAEVVSTPFLDSLAVSKNGAYFKRFISNGQPTIYSFMTIQTGIIPHSSKVAARSFVADEIESVPSILKKHGYHTAFYSGSDPDFDNQRFWLTKWYDKVSYKPSKKEKDRLVFRDAANYLNQNADIDIPFLMTIFSITNHTPFRCPEKDMMISKGDSSFDHLHNTMHYTDNVIQEFFNKIKDKPWFKNTVFIITGDHGYDLGDRGTSTGHSNCRHETDWVPLIIYSENRSLKLPRGKQMAVASHIDIAPTIMDINSIRDCNSFMGHSMLKKSINSSTSINVHYKNYGYETKNFTLYVPANGKSFLYSGKDFLQKKDISRENTETVKKYKKRIKDISLVADYMYEKNLFLHNKRIMISSKTVKTNNN